MRERLLIPEGLAAGACIGKADILAYSSALPGVLVFAATSEAAEARIVELERAVAQERERDAERARALTRLCTPLADAIGRHYGQVPELLELWFREQPRQEIDLWSVVGCDFGRGIAEAVIRAAKAFHDEFPGWSLDDRCWSTTTYAGRPNLQGFAKIPLPKR